MVSNLTHPIILNATLNATLIQSPQPLWIVWLPALVSVAVVFIGGIVTYYINHMLERDKRQFELKKEIYIKYLEILSDIDLMFMPHTEIDAEFVEKFGNLYREMMIMMSKIRICDATPQVIDLTAKLTAPLSGRSDSGRLPKENVREVFSEMQEKIPELIVLLVYAMKHDLGKVN